MKLCIKPVHEGQVVFSPPCTQGFNTIHIFSGSIIHVDRYEDLPANGKFVTVMTSSNLVVVKELSKFVH